MKEKVIGIFLKHCPFLGESFTDLEMKDMGINSISFIQIVVDIEETFGFEFDDEDLDYEKFRTMDDLYEYIDTKSTV